MAREKESFTGNNHGPVREHAIAAPVFDPKTGDITSGGHTSRLSELHPLSYADNPRVFPLFQQLAIVDFQELTERYMHGSNTRRDLGMTTHIVATIQRTREEMTRTTAQAGLDKKLNHLKEAFLLTSEYEQVDRTLDEMVQDVATLDQQREAGVISKVTFKYTRHAIQERIRVVEAQNNRREPKEKHLRRDERKKSSDTATIPLTQTAGEIITPITTSQPKSDENALTGEVIFKKRREERQYDGPFKSFLQYLDITDSSIYDQLNRRMIIARSRMLSEEITPDEREQIQARVISIKRAVSRIRAEGRDKNYAVSAVQEEKQALEQAHKKGTVDSETHEYLSLEWNRQLAHALDRAGVFGEGTLPPELNGKTPHAVKRERKLAKREARRQKKLAKGEDIFVAQVDSRSDRVIMGSSEGSIAQLVRPVR